MVYIIVNSVHMALVIMDKGVECGVHSQFNQLHSYGYRAKSPEVICERYGCPLVSVRVCKSEQRAVDVKHA